MVGLEIIYYSKMLNVVCIKMACLMHHVRFQMLAWTERCRNSRAGERVVSENKKSLSSLIFCTIMQYKQSWFLTRRAYFVMCNVTPEAGLLQVVMNITMTVDGATTHLVE